VILQGNPLAKQDSTNNQQIGFMESLKEPHFWHQIKSLFCIFVQNPILTGLIAGFDPSIKHIN